MQRRQTDESVTGAGETGPRLGARHERKCWLGAAWELPIADGIVGMFFFSD